MQKAMIKSATISMLLGLVSACGGGSGTTSAPVAITPTPVQAAPSSTALADNPLSANTDFNQFNEYLAQLPDRASLFSSNDIYIKLYLADGSTLFLGRLHSVATVQIYLPNHIKSVMVDIFSTNPEDPQITEEIVL